MVSEKPAILMSGGFAQSMKAFLLCAKPENNCNEIVVIYMKLKQLIKSENGAAQMVEAAIIYPIVFLCFFFIIYVGLFILQTMTVGACANKVALLAAREVAYPGYLDLIVTGDSAYETGTVDADLGNARDQAGTIQCHFETERQKIKPYRYWDLGEGGPLDDEARNRLKAILESDGKLVIAQSLIGDKNVNAKIDCKNNVISQTIVVEITQDLANFGILDYFGIETPKLKVSSTASVNDQDEFVRNTDFVIRTMEKLAKKLGINVDKMKESVTSALKKVGIID